MTASELTKETLFARIEAALAYATGAIDVTWSADGMDEACRKALDDMSLAAGVVFTVANVGEAEATTLLVEDETTLVNGACYLLGFARTVERLENPLLTEESPGRTLEWAEHFMVEYNKGINRIRLRGLRESANAPHAEMEWDESTKTW